MIKGMSPEIGITRLTANLAYINGFHAKFETLKNAPFDFVLVFGN
ncbi:hypothetical protein LJPFL01_2562 [Lelliottia jeotgali]|nr:hypothetical protein LJPFL01_2562 [Lelliottia jeotgali]